MSSGLDAALQVLVWALVLGLVVRFWSGGK